MIIKYSIGSKEFNTDTTNDDLIVTKNNNDNRYTITIKALKDMLLDKASLDIKFNANFKDLYFFNGYQSWTDSFESKLARRERNIYKSPHLIAKSYAMDKYGDATFYKYSIKKSHGYNIFYSKGLYESFIYNINYNIAYLVIEIIKDKKDIRLVSDTRGIKLKKGEEITIFDYYFYNNFNEGLASFRNNFKKKNIDKLFGYTSWYNYYQNINENIILNDLNALDSRFNLFQIDDGYETFVGDWLDIDKNKFPNGLLPIVSKIHEKGMKAGIWIAPFVAEQNSQLFKNHKELFLKDEKGNYLKAGGNWSGFYSLDMENSEAREYVRKSLNYYKDLGFDFFKLDFLYASHIKTKEGKSRAMTANEYYHFLREVLGDKIILGCGANLMSSYNNFDYLRVGPDVSLIFDDIWYMKMFHRERISTKVTIQNTIYRSIFNNYLFGNDPDVFLLRDDNIKLSNEQKYALSIINSLFSSILMTSDNVSTYDENKNKVLNEVLDNFNNAKNISYETKGVLIQVSYEINGKVIKYSYNKKKGVFLDGQN